MDTPESPSQTSLSPEEGEDEKSLPDSELLDSHDEEEDRLISDSEVVQEEDNEEMVDDDDDDEVLGRGSECEEQREEEDEVVPDFVSDLEDEEPLGESEGVGQEDGTIMLVEGDEDCPPSEQLDRETEDIEEEDRVIDTPQSPDSEHPTSFIGGKDGEKRSIYQKGMSGGSNAAELEDEDDKTKAEEREKNERMRAEVRRRAIAVSEMKDDSASVARELDEHELDYDEEVPEEPSVPPQEEDEDEEDAKAEGDAESEDKSGKKREKKIILPPKDREGKRTDGPLGPERIRRNSSKDKKKEEDDGEIDEGEIDDDDLEEGEVKDPSDRKIRPRPICRFFIKGNCTWGMNCRFIHPGVNDKGNYSLITKPDLFASNGAPPGGPHPLIPTNPWTGPAVEELPPPPPPPPPPVEPPVESAWERGLRHAKEVLKKATIRKEQEPDFEEKRFNVTIGEDEREFDKENEFFRERSYRIIRDEMDYRDPIYSDPYPDPYYDYEMEALWRGGHYENFRVQYTEGPLPYHYSQERERDCDPRERHRDRDRERDHRERERRQREREREREREKERMRRKEEWEKDRLKRDEKERPRMRPPREAREKEEEKEKLKTRPPLDLPPTRPVEPNLKKEAVLVMRRPDEWKDPWRRSKSPRRRPGLGSPPRGRRRHRPSGSSVSVSNSSRSSSRSSSYTGSGSSRSRSRSSSFSSYSSHSSQHSSFSGSRSRSRSFSTSPSPSPATLRNAKPKADLPPLLPKGEKPSMKKVPSPPPPLGIQGRPPKPPPDLGKPPAGARQPGGTGVSGAARPPPPREPGKPPNPRTDKKKERQEPPPHRRASRSVSGSGSSYSGSSSRSRSSNSLSRSRSRSGSRKSRSLSVSSVSSVSSASSGSSSARSADSDDMYADLASPVSSASSRSPTPSHPGKERGAVRERAAHARDKTRERPPKKEESFREDRRKMDPAGISPRGGNPVHRSGPANRGVHPLHPPPGLMGPPGGRGGSGSHKDIKLTLLNKQADKSRKRYLASEKTRPGSPPSKRMAFSPDRGREKRIPLRPPLSPRMDRPRGQGPRPLPPQGDRKRPLSPPPKSSGKGPMAPSGRPAVPASASGAGSGSNKPSNTLSRREELLKQLKAVEDAIARKRAKIPTK
ncbi:zinc finger CCCH domain-containing protein 18 isoform X4 [Takifugu rubripes]|uniref:zinc finger CCCH domain-containing protein 18 isoform X4 n=1 Tax=Takifugu rubripes TaxID=31033 RepID=UPI001145CB11|nr:zinc finger CCCH domain-containing protein 18 isoform X4 [Takifugu rubripes]